MNSTKNESLNLRQDSENNARAKRTLRIHPLEILQRNMPWAILIVIAIIFSRFSDNFFSFNNIINILAQNSYIILAAIGVAFVMMAGQLDLSVGYLISLIGIVCAMLMMDFGWSAAVVFGVGLLMGIALSVLNMSLSLVLKIPLFMVTVGTMTIYQGFSFQISQARTIGGFSPFFKFLGQGMIGPIPFPIILTAVLFVIMNIFLRKTYWGQYIYAVGGNEDAAHLTGINTISVKMMIAIVAGAFVGLSALVMASRIGSMQSAIGPGTEFTVITGILLGGVSFRGGEGRLSGVLAGVLIMAILSNGMQLAHMGVYFQYIAKGSIMLAAIGFDIFQLSRREKAKSKRKTPKLRQNP